MRKIRFFNFFDRCYHEGTCMLYEPVAEMVIDLLFQNGDRLVRKGSPELIPDIYLYNILKIA